MENTNMLRAKDIALELGVSEGKAYKIIRELNQELKEQGYIVVAGRIPRAFWNKKHYS